MLFCSFFPRQQCHGSCCASALVACFHVNRACLWHTCTLDASGPKLPMCPEPQYQTVQLPLPRPQRPSGDHVEWQSPQRFLHRCPKDTQRLCGAAGCSFQKLRHSPRLPAVVLAAASPIPVDPEAPEASPLPSP
jgi:hypothetical protein